VFSAVLGFDLFCFLLFPAFSALQARRGGSPCCKPAVVGLRAASPPWWVSEAGKYADIIAVQGNPLDNISVMQKITFMKGGVVFKK